MAAPKNDQEWNRLREGLEVLLGWRGGRNKAGRALTTNQLKEVKEFIARVSAEAEKVEKDIAKVADLAESTREDLNQTKTALGKVQTGLNTANQQLGQLNSGLSSAEKRIDSLSEDATSAKDTLDVQHDEASQVVVMGLNSSEVSDTPTAAEHNALRSDVENLRGAVAALKNAVSGS